MRMTGMMRRMARMLAVTFFSRTFRTWISCESNQIKSNQIKSNQIKSNQIK
jgi:hypothetical protein